MPHYTFKEFLSEAKFSKPIIAYHATRIENVQSILKHGLIPNKKGDGWGSEDYNMDVGISLKALSGIYFTDSAESAIDIASELAYKDAAIVICKIQRKMAAMDEDDLDKILESLYKDLRKIAIKINKSETINNFELMSEIEKYVNSVKEKVIKLAGDTESQQIEKIKNISERYIHKVFDNFVNWTYHEDMELANSLESTIRNYREQLTNLLFKSPDTRERFNKFRINSPITFSGANKIIGIVQFKLDIRNAEISSFECKYGNCGYIKEDDLLRVIFNK